MYPQLLAAPPSITGCEAGRLPLLLQPRWSAQGGLVSTGIACSKPRSFGHLLHERGLANLPRARDHLYKAAWLGEAAGERSVLWAGEVR